MDATSTPAIRRATREQDVVRLLFILNAAGSTAPQGSPEGAVTVMIGQARLQALDFWMRNPDYFADELLNEVDSGRMDSKGIDLALGILDSDEPDLRRYPMVRWLFGAYEPLDDALAVLRANGLIAL